MQPKNPLVATNATGNSTCAEAKRRLQAKGVTLKKFAEDNGFKYRIVSEVIRGVNKGLYGQGYEVARALGIK